MGGLILSGGFGSLLTAHVRKVFLRLRYKLTGKTKDRYCYYDSLSLWSVDLLFSLKPDKGEMVLNFQEVKFYTRMPVFKCFSTRAHILIMSFVSSCVIVASYYYSGQD